MSEPYKTIPFLQQNSDGTIALTKCQELITITPEAITELLKLHNNKVRELSNALSDFRQADTDSIRALHERNELRDKLQLSTQQLKSLAELVDELIDNLDIPTPNCGCHLVAPCHDCVEFAGIREQISTVRSVITPLLLNPVNSSNETNPDTKSQPS